MQTQNFLSPPPTGIDFTPIKRMIDSAYKKLQTTQQDVLIPQELDDGIKDYNDNPNPTRLASITRTCQKILGHTLHTQNLQTVSVYTTFDALNDILLKNNLPKVSKNQLLRMPYEGLDLGGGARHRFDPTAAAEEAVANAKAEAVNAAIEKGEAEGNEAKAEADAEAEAIREAEAREVTEEAVAAEIEEAIRSNPPWVLYTKINNTPVVEGSFKQGVFMKETRFKNTRHKMRNGKR